MRRTLYFAGQEPVMDAGQLEARKARAQAWFESLRNDICAAFEAVEDALPADAPYSDRPAGPVRAQPVARIDHNGTLGGGARCR